MKSGMLECPELTSPVAHIVATDGFSTQCFCRNILKVSHYFVALSKEVFDYKLLFLQTAGDCVLHGTCSVETTFLKQLSHCMYCPSGRLFIRLNHLKPWRSDIRQ